MSEKKRPRTAAGLRDLLFDEIEELRTESADPPKSQVVANLAKEIIRVARAEIEMQKQLTKDSTLCDDYQMGELRLGERANVVDAKAIATEQ